MSALKIGVLGCGQVAERHLAAYRKLPVEIVVADVVEAPARSLAAQYGVGFGGHPEEVFRDPTVTAVDICVPTAYHAQVILRALEHGKGVFCEKPLCETLAEARQIQEAARHTRGVLMVGYLQRFHPGFQMVKQVMDEGVIGRPYLSLVRVGGRGDRTVWKHQKTLGGGVVLEMLVHKLDQLVWFFGPAERVDVLAYDVLRPVRHIDGEEVAADAEDLIVLDMEMGGVRVLCQGDFVTPGYMDQLEVQGDNGSIFTSLLDYLPTVITLKEKRGDYPEGTTRRSFPTVNLFDLELTHFVQALRDGQPNTVNSLGDSLRVMEIVDHIWRYAEAHGKIGL